MINLFFLHGLASTSSAFDALRRALPASYHFTAHDYAAHRRRPDDVYSAQPLHQAAEECVQIIQKTEGKFVLAGHSMGNAIAMLVLEKIPERIAGLVSLEGNLMIENCGLISRKLVSAEGDAELAAIKSKTIDWAKNQPSAGWREWADDLATIDIKTMRDYARELVALCETGELLAAFTNFSGPKCYLYGDSYAGSEMVKKLGDIPAHHIPHSEHFLLQDQPALCARYIQQVCEAIR